MTKEHQPTSWVLFKLAVAGVVASVVALLTAAGWTYLYGADVEWAKALRFGLWQISVVALVAVLAGGAYGFVSDRLDRVRSRRLLAKHNVRTDRSFNAQCTRLDANGVAGTFTGTFRLVARPHGVGYAFEIRDDSGNLKLRSQDTTMLRLAEEGDDLLVRWEYEGNDLEKQAFGYRGVMECRLHHGMPVLLKYYNNRPSAGWMKFEDAGNAAV